MRYHDGLNERAGRGKERTKGAGALLMKVSEAVVVVVPASAADYSLCLFFI